MDAIALASAIRKTRDILGNLLVEECTRLYWLREDIEWIQTEMRRIQPFLEDADTKLFTSQGMANLVTEVRNLAYDVGDIIDTYMPVVQTHERGRFLSYLQCLGCILCDWYTKHNFVMEIASIKRRVEDINCARTTYSTPDETRTERPEELWRPRNIPPHVDEPIIIGFETHTEKLRKRLLDREIHHCCISIVGMPGVGKTTLARQVYNSIKANFECCAWVSVSQKPRVRDLLKEISTQVGIEREKWENNADMEANLYEFLKQKRYLIVLDDIWNTETWDAFRIGIPNSGIEGSRLIISSRFTDVGRYARGDTSLHELLPLNDEQSWELFSKIVKLPLEHHDETNTSPELTEVGRQISRRCGGVPLTIAVMARLIVQKERTEYTWRRVLDGMGQQAGQISEIIALSYRDLPYHLEPCFLYFGLFPEDHEIPASELTSLWAAEGYIKAREGQTLEDVGEDCLMELVDRNLIQIAWRKFDGRIKSCCIHDVLHNLCISIAKENFNACHGKYSATDAQIRRIAIHHKIGDYMAKKNRPPKLRALLGVNKKQEILRREHLEHVDKEFRLIRVLCLEVLEFPRSFPNAIGKLIHLRCLRLTGSCLRSLPSTISNLRNLQTLDVQECEQLILPAVIWKMQELRHVLLDPTTRFQHPLRCTQFIRRHQLITDVSLPNLQILLNLNGDFLIAKCLLQLGNLRKLGLRCCMKQFARVLTDGMPISHKLEKLQLEVWDDGPINAKRSREIPELEVSSISDNQSFPTPAGPPLNFSGYESLCNIYLDGPLISLPEFTSSLTKLTLVRSALKLDPMEELQKLPNLKKLQLRGSSYMGCMMVVSGEGSFPRLEVLVIEKMPSLKVLKVEDGVMPKLGCVKINCPITLEIQSDRLKNIFSEFNEYLMCMSFLELEVSVAWPEDDFIWEEDDSILPPTEIGDEGKKLISEKQAEQEITEVQRGIFGNPLELGQSSSSEAP